MTKAAKKEVVFDMATCWKMKDVVENYLPDEPRLMGGYIDARYHKVRVTVTAEILPKPTQCLG